MDPYAAPAFHRDPYASQEMSLPTTQKHAMHCSSSARPSSGNLFFGSQHISQFFASPSCANTTRDLPNFPPPTPGGSASPFQPRPEQRGPDAYGYMGTQRSASCSTKSFWRDG
ncbi:hypothetical protein PIB30_102593 [Stylosanthes scabra]|uniref:Uncharacterized protein n=1 Tax=Stylosanthes scabra TaxID=79078 RepID=A0ABU6W0W7_9FABA|nr:hypothetical protein [Stylosanthes scabra]